MAETKKKTNRLLVLGLVLAALAVAIFFAADPFGLFKPSEEERQASLGLSKVLTDFTAMTITAFEIKPPGAEAFRVFKEPGSDQWFVQLKDKKYRADRQRVDKLLEQVPGLKAEGAATSSKDAYAQYEVDDSLGIGLKVFTGGETPALSLIVGKADPSYQGCFLRLENDEAVYRASQNIKSLVGFSGSDFRSRNPWKFEPATATEITIRPPAGGPAVTLTKSGEYWQAGGKNANQNLIQETLKKLSELTANAYVDDVDPKLTQFKPEPAITVKTNTAEYKLTLGAAESSQLYAQDQDGWVFRVAEYALKFYTDLAPDQLLLDDTAQDKAGTEAGGAAPPGAAPGNAASPGATPVPPATGLPPAPPGSAGK